MFSIPSSLVDSNPLAFSADTLAAALACLAKTGLDFGAVDVIYTKDERVYVLEINTAPGLEGQTVLDYKVFFEEIIP